MAYTLKLFRFMSSSIKKTKRNKVLTLETINKNVLNVQYAVRGPISIQASEIEDQLSQGIKKPFEYVLRSNIGDCHATGQKPLTFVRQILAAVIYPELIKMDIFPSDVVERALSILKTINGSVGCYSESNGLKIIRKWVSEFIKERDGIHCDPNSIIMTNGASSAVKLILTLLMNNDKDDNKKTGIMVPIPQYPLYSATIAELNGKMINYQLNEDNNWAVDIEDMKKTLFETKSRCIPKAIVVINPGNPTGQILSLENMQQIIKLCHEENLVLIADEVYQENIYMAGAKFLSFKKVLSEMGDEYGDLELFSLHSASKGYSGECGLRGGYVECYGINEDVMKQLQKLQSAQLGSSVLGQIAFGSVLNSPKQHEPSYDLYNKEKNQILDSLGRKAELVHTIFNSIEGVSCNIVQGAMYGFVRINLPFKVLEKAKELKLEPDEFYCQRLLEETGFCTVPGSGFGQKTGTYHFRTTILPETRKMEIVLDRFSSFHREFIKHYS